jgi:surfactin synthase thioesterase subunit
VPVDQVSRKDDFFDRGSSLSAVKLAVTLQRKVSLKEITRNPVLADLAALLDSKTGASGDASGTPRRTGLLQPLSVPEGPPVAALICFPYAGGNAVNFQPMAKELKDSGLRVYAVELPGHDLGAEREAFVPTAKVIEQVVAEIGTLGLKSVMLWGHSAGTAAALEAARQLTERGVTVARVFLGAQLLGDIDARRARIAELTGRSDAEIVAGLSGDSGYTGLAELDAQRAEHVGAAYRHDYVSANRYFAEAMERPPVTKVTAPVTVVIAADDPSTAAYRERYGDWGLLADSVDLHELVEGGHYFLRTRPDEAARAVLGATELLTSS